MAVLRRPPGLRLVLLLALLPLAALPWLGQRFIETVAAVARDVQLDNLQVTARGLAASLQDRLELLDPATGLGLPLGVEAVAPTPVNRPPDMTDGGWVDADGWHWHRLPVERFGSAPITTLGVEAAVLRDGRGSTARRWLVVRARDERVVPAGQTGGGADADPVAAASLAGAGDSLTVTAGSTDDWTRLVSGDQLARAEARALALPAERRLYPVPIVATDDLRTTARTAGAGAGSGDGAPVPGWMATLDLPDDARLIRLEVTDVDYLGTRRLEARADSGWWLLVEADDSDAGLAAAALLEARRANILRIFDQAPGDVSIEAADGRLLAERRQSPPAMPPPATWTAKLARRVLGIGGAPASARGEAAGDAGAHGRVTDGDGGPVDAGRREAVAGALAGIPTRASTPVAAAGALPVWRLTAAQPIWNGGDVTGVLVVEDSTLSRAAAGLSTIESLSGLVLLAFAASLLAVFGVATFTVHRIGRLRRAADDAIDARGRVVGAVPTYRWHDEVGLLAQSHARVLDRLREHQRYLTRLRSWLAHELRTPVMIVRSSLENLVAEAQSEAPTPNPTPASPPTPKSPPNLSPTPTPTPTPSQDAVARYGQRALDGAARLEQILSAMSAAASLESMLESQDLEPVDLVGLGRACVDGYALAYPAHRWRFDSPLGSAPALAVPDAIGQALDKLAANAADFAPAGSTIVLTVDAAPGLRPGTAPWRIVLANDGPPLPDGDLLALFESLVSVRPQTPSSPSPLPSEPQPRPSSPSPSSSAPDASSSAPQPPPHLGLGLHLVRLIAEFHGGTVLAGNRPGGVWLGFTVPSVADR